MAFWDHRYKVSVQELPRWVDTLYIPHFGLGPKRLMTWSEKEPKINQSSVYLTRLHVRGGSKNAKNLELCRCSQVSTRSKQKSFYASNYFSK